MTQNLVDEVLERAIHAGASSLDEPSGKRILDSLGVRVPRFVVVPSIQDLAHLGADLRPPFVLKVVSSQILHKSDLGCVRLNLQSAQALASAASDMQERVSQAGFSVDGWLVEEMAQAGVEVVVGGTFDPEFGPMIMLGLGGIFVEVLKDVAFRICPISAWDAQDMINELKGRDLLYGARGKEPVNVAALVDVLMKVGGESGLLMRAGQKLQGLDINPIIVTPHAAIAVDARFILTQENRHVA